MGIGIGIDQVQIVKSSPESIRRFPFGRFGRFVQFTTPKLIHGIDMESMHGIDPKSPTLTVPTVSSGPKKS